MNRRRSPRKYRVGPRTRAPARRRSRKPAPPIAMEAAVRARMERCRVPESELRWHCDPALFEFRTTAELPPSRGFLCQREAVQAMRIGFALSSPGYNLFVCGLSGSHKVQLVEEFARQAARRPSAIPDRVYVQNFADPRRPLLLELPRGKGRRLQMEVAAVLHAIQGRLEGVPERRWKRCAAEVLEARVPRLLERFSFAPVVRWLGEWKRRLLRGLKHATIEDFEVNCLGQPSRGREPPVIVETNPTHANLFGWIGRRGIGDQQPQPHFTEISRGAFLEADGGVLILDASDVYNAPGSWTTLKSCLKYGTLEIQDGDPSAPARTGTLKPEPIPVSVKVVLLGDYALYDYLFESDPDFQDVFKIRVDFQPDTTLSPRVMLRDYPRLLARICRDEGLLPLTAGGVAEVIEYGVRKAGRKKKVTVETSLVEDLLREADYWAREAARARIGAEDVERALREAVDRVNLVERKIAEMIAEGTILISTAGSRVGQVNGLAIYDMGDYFFGKPSRITAETSVGHGGIINIERESGFSGRSHDKGVQILGGYLRSCFAQSRPLSLTASVCFEQSYSGIDGDSASATEIYAILSSLSGLPIRQDIAVTGSLSQKGDIQPIGGVNEKIEGFFDCIQAGRPSGHEGVIIPRKNIGELMLRRDVVRAVRDRRFHIYAIDTVAEGIEILTGIEAGRRQRGGRYPEGTVFGRVDRRLEELASDLRKYGESEGDD